jgi:ubiquitin fusion degradation protein 1
MLLWLVLALLSSTASASDGVAAPQRKTKPQWQARLATSSIASVARREQRTEWNEVTQGNKIVLPRRVLEYLEKRGLPYTQFQIMNPEHRETRLFTGPLDFCAADGQCYLPSWLMKQLKLKEGDACAVALASFPSAVFAKFQPHSSDFLDIPDHYMMLMETLENFAALTEGCTIRVTDGKKVYPLDVLEVKGKALKGGERDDSRGRAIDLAWSEIAIDFEPPKDLVKKQKPSAADAGGANGEGEAAGADADANGDDAAEDAATAARPRPARGASSRRGGDPAEEDEPKTPVAKFKAKDVGEAGAKKPAARRLLSDGVDAKSPRASRRRGAAAVAEEEEAPAAELTPGEGTALQPVIALLAKLGQLLMSLLRTLQTLLVPQSVTHGGAPR